MPARVLTKNTRFWHHEITFKMIAIV